MISDFFGARYGMRGRLWWLWVCQTIGGVLCVVLGLVSHNFTATLVVICLFSLFIQVRKLPSLAPSNIYTTFETRYTRFSNEYSRLGAQI